MVLFYVKWRNSRERKLVMSEAKLSEVTRRLEKKFGKNVLRKASDLTELSMVKVPTGSLILDTELGGGYPLGRLIQIRGHFSASKSTLAYHAIKHFLAYFDSIGRKDLKVLLVQGEHGSFTREYIEDIGVDIDRLIISESASMEEALEVAITLHRGGIVGLVVHDSFASYVPMKVSDSDMDETTQMGLKPKLFDEYCCKIQASNNKLTREDKLPCTVIGLNQLREKIGAYGDPEYSPGGKIA